MKNGVRYMDPNISSESNRHLIICSPIALALARPTSADVAYFVFPRKIGFFFHFKVINTLQRSAAGHSLTFSFGILRSVVQSEICHSAFLSRS